MAFSRIRVGIDDEHDAPGDACSQIWMDALLNAPCPSEVRLEVETKTKAIEVKVPDGRLVATYDKESQTTSSGRHHKIDRVWDTPGALVRVEDAYHCLRIRVLVSEDESGAAALLQEIRQQIAPPPVRKKTEVKIKFWRMTSRGASSFTRPIEAPTWRSIQRNYAPGPRAHLSQLMRVRPRSLGTGKIVLLHGPAGTGKTTAIRSLAREWKRWCDFAYAVDPERVFGNGEYLTSLIADTETEDTDWDSPDIGVSSKAPKWRLLIIEDAEEFLVPDAKHEVGQAVSRLLNVGDGILGQGLKLLVMLTTNVPVAKLSPAITRAGRCLANIEVPPMSKDEATEWLGREAGGKRTLAELWELAHPSQIGTGIGDGAQPGQYL